MNEAMYKQAIREEEANIQKNRAQETVELLQDLQYPPRTFKLDQ